jgi:hypothetical protein
MPNEELEQNAADIIMPDMAWTGGLSETRKICAGGRLLSADHQPRHYRTRRVVVGGASHAAYSQCHDYGNGAGVS